MYTQRAQGIDSFALQSLDHVVIWEEPNKSCAIHIFLKPFNLFSSQRVLESLSTDLFGFCCNFNSFRQP